VRTYKCDNDIAKFLPRVGIYTKYKNIYNILDSTISFYKFVHKINWNIKEFNRILLNIVLSDAITWV
jgi:hypothetical protein